MADRLVRRTRVRVIYEGKDISQDIAPDLLSLSYTDNEGGVADDVSLTLKNDHGLWTGAWLPRRGDTIDVTIIPEGEGALPDLKCGRFTVDELEASGPPSTFSIKGTSMPANTNAARRKRSRAWEEVRLSEIVKDFEDTYGMTILLDIDEDPVFLRRDQRSETDLAFLSRVCDDEGLAVKCTDDRLVVFSRQKREQAAPVVALRRGEALIRSWSFRAQSHSTYAQCVVEYQAPDTDEALSFTYKQSGVGAGKTLKVRKRVESLAEAERLAQARLHDANRHEVEGRLELAGDTRLVAGATVDLEGFGAFDGIYYITKAAHSIGTGYTTSVDLTNTRKKKPGKKSVVDEVKSDGLEDLLG